MTSEELQHLIPTLRPKLVALATRYLKDSDEAEDVVQDAMLKLWMLRQQIIGNAEGFAQVMVRNMALNRLRQLHRTETLSDFDKLEMEDDETTAENEEEVARLLSIVETLPERQKLILQMHDLEGMEYEEIAMLTGTSPSALRQTVSRSRRWIRMRYLAAVSAVLAVVIAITWGFRTFQNYRLERRYEGSYIVVGGERNDNLREIHQQLEQTLASAENIETTIKEHTIVREAESDVLESISDPDERRRIEEILKQ